MIDRHEQTDPDISTEQQSARIHHDKLLEELTKQVLLSLTSMSHNGDKPGSAPVFIPESAREMLDYAHRKDDDFKQSA